MAIEALDLTFCCFGARIAIRSDVPDLLSAAMRSMPPGAEPQRMDDPDCLFELRTGNAGHLSLYEDDRVLAGNLQVNEALDELQSVLHVAVARNARDFVFVHAGVAAWQGKAIVIPGRTMSGKTSLVAALVRGGAGYFSDEYAVLDPQGRVHPYGKSLSVRDASGKGRNTGVETIGGRQWTQPCSMGMLIHTAFEPGARWQPRRLSSAKAMLAMLDNTVMVRDNPELAMQAIGQSLRGVQAYAGPRGEADELVRALL